MANKWCLRAFAILGLLVLSAGLAAGQVGQTQITKWQYGKSAAVSLTYDDGSINQFRVAVPIMDTFGFPATFFIITGDIPGSRWRSLAVPEIFDRQETANTQTNKDNFLNALQRLAFLAIQARSRCHTRASGIRQGRI
jgi:hypothetical protein